MQERYYKFSKYLKDRFGCAVYKVSIDAGFSCPHEDGCIYCDNKAFSLNTAAPFKPVRKQIEEGIAFGRRRYKAQKFIVYFQAHTNTNAALAVLKERYDLVNDFDNVVGIAIGTRPDCIDEKKLDLIEGYSKRYEVWLEYGLQSIHNNTLELINRNHRYEDFLKAVELTRKRNIKICAHVIIGLPQEKKEQIMETAAELGRLKLDGVKIHPLHVIKGTRLEEHYRAGSYKPLTLPEFTDLAAGFLTCLCPDTVIQRISADCPRELLVAPSWILDKKSVLTAIDTLLTEKNTFQGANFK